MLECMHQENKIKEVKNENKIANQNISSMSWKQWRDKYTPSSFWVGILRGGWFNM